MLVGFRESAANLLRVQSFVENHFGVTVRGDGGVAGKGRVVGVPKFHSWCKCTMPCMSSCECTKVIETIDHSCAVSFTSQLE